MDVAAVDDLATLRSDAGAAGRRPGREQVARMYARARGRIITTELASILGAHRTSIGNVLQGLERQGELAPSRENRRGAGFYYRHVAGED